jgi:D-alanyl-D-alanine carboxypeptidase
MKNEAPEKETIHGEPEVKPRFGPGSDDAQPLGNPSDPRGDVASGDSSDPRDEKSLSDDQLSQRENSDDNQNTESDSQERDSLNFTGDEKPGRMSNFRKKIIGNARKKATIGVVTAIIGFGGAGIFSIVQGPLEFIHISQLLQKFYTQSNEDFGDDRSFKSIYYALSGQSERGRLGITGNYYANKWEKRFLDNYGIRPIYNDNIRGLAAGWEIVDEDMARGSGILDQVQEAVPGSEVKRAKDINGLGIKGPKGATVKADSLVLHFKPGTNLKDIRKASKAVTKSIGINQVSTAIGSRVSVKRTGSTISPLNKARQKLDENQDGKEKLAFEEEQAKKREEIISNGVKTGNLSGEAKAFVDNLEEQTAGKSKAEANALRSAAVKGAGPVVILGLLCSANDLGNQAQEAKFINNIKPLIRMFWYFTSVGEQAKSGNKISLDELGALKKVVYDKETKTHILNAKPLQAELGKPQTGADVPLEARPNRLGDKPDAFEAVSTVLDFGLSIPGPDIKLSTGCAAINAVAGLPGIEQLSELLTGGINVALSTIGTSTDELMASLISVINGESVDTRAVGDSAGALLGMGGKLASIDQSLITGGTGLSPAQAYEIREEQRLLDIEDSNNLSFFARYLDPLGSKSLAGTSLVEISNSTRELQSPASSITSLFSSILPSFENKTLAAVSTYDYGVKDYGYSLKDQDDENFADPYSNAVIVESQLEQLNEKYSKCFGIKVNADDTTGVHIESSEVNILKLENDPEFEDCRKFNDSSNSAEAIMFKRYRFYIADAMSALSLACFEGDESDPIAQKACTELGTGQTSTTTTNLPPSSPSGATIDLSVLASDSDQIPCAEGTKDLGVVQTLFTLEAIVPSGNAPKIRLCQLSSITGEGNNTSGVVINGGAVVSSPVSGAWQKLGEAAKADGVSLVSSSSFRLAHSCGGTGDGGSCARPGKSPHQSGVAIDFANMGGFDAKGSTTSCEGRMTYAGEAWNWMKNNAQNFGIFQYSAESWHWDPFYVLGNRCDKAGTGSKDSIPPPSSTNSSNSTVSTDAKTLAAQILNNNKINISSGSFCRYCTEDIRNTANGNPAYGSVNLDIKLLQFLAELGQNNQVDVNSITGAGSGHSAGSNHYKGIAIDFGCNGISGDILDRIGAKYGIKSNFERCDANENHWHYSIGGG